MKFVVLQFCKVCKLLFLQIASNDKIQIANREKLYKNTNCDFVFLLKVKNCNEIKINYINFANKNKCNKLILHFIAKCKS